MSMLILNMSDSHLTGKNPMARVDDLTIVQWEKWKEVISIANDYDIPIVSGGDIFNVPVIANSILTRFGEILDQLNNPLYFVIGNHDLMYHNLEMLERTSIGVLWANNNKVRHISEFENDYGIKWDYCDWNQPITEVGGQFLLIHQAIVQEKLIGKNSWILDDKEFSMTIENNEFLHKYKMILCGHWHHQYTFTYKDTKVVNSGPLVRRTVDDTRMPTINLINLDTRFVERIPLKTAKPTEVVLSNKHLDSKINIVKESIVQFVQQLEQKGAFGSKQTTTFMEGLISVLDSHELDKPVETFLRDVIAKVMELKIHRKGE
jgi:DNA repair exonuclease SbcCD nuclease subunit